MSTTTTEPIAASGAPYHRAYAGQRRPALRGIVAIVLLLVGFVGLAQLFLVVGGYVDREVFGRSGTTPITQAAGALALAALIPYCMVLQRVLYGVPAGSLHSVAGRFRLDVFARALLMFGPLVLVAVSVGSLLEPGEQVPWTTGDLIAYFVIGMLLTPLAAAGEEYGFRGFLFRVLGGWTRGARSGALVGIVVTTVGFSLIHGSLDPYILTSYLVLFGSLGIMTWRTGGLETAVVVHAVYNVAGLVLATALRSDFTSALDDRGAVVGSPVFLIPSAALVVVTAVVWWRTRRAAPTSAAANQASLVGLHQVR
ncbi:CPBP family intramembrane glutamic endopeptidase [Williamsia sp. CHRR-6]|uniref:CPBP family intramembrane glutamic endopeptidase n=1 Tax=Williamsia sp. CHRR-6 TaxID=2835871 RepID=UPI001BDA57AC|nr:CPBP family intramembrane glutamic endopeptidase [Williamsia sp. CHRR-6]MBT0566895.1 CPBP family intramembrane metalloprotease [Williamsia sp. CHRR-6]